MTNASKALISQAVNAALVLVIAFGVELSDAQVVATVGFVNAALAIWVGLTYGNSRKRIPD